MATPIAIVAYMVLFASIGFLFLFVNLLVGRLVRPSDPNEEKLEIYECGEPTIGSSFVQFDLRFYVVALVFIVFDVEVAFLFPLATVFGKSAALADTALAEADAAIVYRELGVADPVLPPAEGVTVAEAGLQMAKLTFWTINVFFIVLLIGFAYEWKTGAFDWVRAVTRERALEIERAPPAFAVEETLKEQPTVSV
jgi:NADH-quinone oxidoreductase subunit A